MIRFGRVGEPQRINKITKTIIAIDKIMMKYEVNTQGHLGKTIKGPILNYLFIQD